MNAAQPAEFYDAFYTGPHSPALTPYWQARHHGLHLEAAGWIPHRSTVIDLGCAIGNLARTLRATGHIGDYHGIDFSPAAIRRCDPKLENCRYTLADLRDWQPDPDTPTTVYVALEILEHIDDDLALLARIPAGRRTIISVPTFDSPAHVRYFTTTESVVARYRDLLDFVRYSRINIEGAVIHAYDTVRR